MNAETPSLGSKAASSAVFTGASQIIRLVLTTLSTIVVSRMLAPADYGIVAMSAPVAGFLLMFQDMGLTQAVVQSKTISHAESNGLFWINIGISALVALVLVIAAPFVGQFYGEPRAGVVTAVTAISVLLTGTSLQHAALMNRDMRFGTLASVDIANVLATFLVTVAAALLLHNYWALVIGTTVGTLVQVALLWGLDGWRPTLPITLKGTREMARFGGNLTGFNLTNFVSRNLPNVLIARFTGAAALGLYDRSYKLMMLPLNNINAPLGRVMLPVLSRLQDDPVRYRRAFLLAIRAMMLISIPGIAVSIATSDGLMIFLLGPTWGGAGPIFFWLALTGLIQPVANATGWLFISSGRGGPMLRWGLFSAIVSIIGFVVGLRWGAVGVAASIFFTALMRVPPLYAYCVKGTSVRQRDLYVAMVNPLIGAAIAWAIAHALLPYLATGPLLCVALPAAYLVAFLVNLMTRDGRELLSTLARLVRSTMSSLASRLMPRKAR
ncbi:lipopolysaccharide biosynthesis protein [Sphingomonas bacterium]|uniref:lipopolysaccharide biosynthesis protein n=1 Tax=Sphingomonas bacterium TaxID=1895847 RepID=UPI001575E071|nr:lipopolysaccharide biosynthesis protein [Sphingomonas bacterium]